MDYNLTIRIDQHWIANFNKHNMRLCFSIGVQSYGETHFNVIAFTSTVQPNTTINWSSNYSIAASKDSFSNGAKFTAATSIQAIQPGQSLTLPGDWTDTPPNPDPRAPRDGFRFKNETEASAIVYTRIGGNISPIYISAAGPLPPGREDLTPKPVCRVWYASGAGTATMITDYESNYMEIDLGSKGEAEVHYDATGTWLNT